MKSAEVVANPVEEAGLGVNACILPVPIDARKRRWSSTPKGLRTEQPAYVAGMRHFSGDHRRNSAPECARLNIVRHSTMSTDQSPDLVSESDRGCVPVGAAILESKLEELFREEFEANQVSTKIQDAIFDSNGPRCTFSSKIKLAYSLGFIGERV